MSRLLATVGLIALTATPVLAAKMSSKATGSDPARTGSAAVQGSATGGGSAEITKPGGVPSATTPPSVTTPSTGSNPARTGSAAVEGSATGGGSAELGKKKQ